jgi:hypothetical protein
MWLVFSVQTIIIQCCNRQTCEAVVAHCRCISNSTLASLRGLQIPTWQWRAPALTGDETDMCAPVSENFSRAFQEFILGHFMGTGTCLGGVSDLTRLQAGTCRLKTVYQTSLARVQVQTSPYRFALIIPMEPREARTTFRQCGR